MRHTTLDLYSGGDRMKDKLTPKQEKFIQNIIKGMSQRQAYRDAFNPDNTSDKTVDEKACRLFNEDKIQARYSDLIKELEKEAIMTALEKRKLLKELALDKENSVNDRLKALDIDNKMAGEYITKVEAGITADININIE
jgi:phage terminase small subunit